MYDPLTVAFEIRYSWLSEPPSKIWPEGYRRSFVTIWHKDPERGGSEDSCGWFKRARHGEPAVLGQIRKDFGFDWDSEHSGWFDAEGRPYFSSQAITLSMFRRAAYCHFKDWGKTERFLRNRLFDILLFAENPVDSMHPFIAGRYGTRDREERIAEAASIIYGCVLRWSLPWYKHPRWHIHHWRLQIHPWQGLLRRYWDKCSKCGKRGFPKGVHAMGDWSGTRIWHSTCEGIAAAEVSHAEIKGAS